MKAFSLKTLFCALALVGQSAALPDVAPADFYNDTAAFFNCYGYASGSRASGYMRMADGGMVKTLAIPGALAGKPMAIFTAEALNESVLADGYEAVEAAQYKDLGEAHLKRDGYRLVAAFIDERLDDTSPSFHFAVRDEAGVWSHKNGTGQVMHERIGGGPLRSPDVHAADYLGDSYAFVGYYWRPQAGINVIGGATPVSAFGVDGRLVSHGLYNAVKMRDDVWVGTRGDYIATSFEIADIEAHTQKAGAYALHIKGEDGRAANIVVPEGLVFGGGDGKARTIELDDPSGPDFVLQIDASGAASLAPQTRSAGSRPAKSPFKP